MEGSFAPNSRIGKYRILRELGRGGMGVVYLAQDTTLRREVALKALHPHYSVDSTLVHRFQQEARAVGSLFHPNVLPVNAFESVDGLLLLEMPYLERGSLDAVLRTRGAYFGEIVRWMGDVLTALGYCHDRGILHRDVKPTNVLLDSGERALLADFGLAKLTDGQMNVSSSTMASAGLFVGTVRYAPPEAWDGAEPALSRDLYSAGVVLYEGMTGKPLFEADTPLAYLKVMARQPVKPPREWQPSISDAANDLVMGLLEKNPEDRPSTAWEALGLLQETPEHRDCLSDSSPTQRPHVVWPKAQSGQASALFSGWSESLSASLKTARRVFPWGGWLAALLVISLVPLGLFSPGRQPEAEAPLSPPETGFLPSITGLDEDVIPRWETLFELTRFAAPEHAKVYQVQEPGPGIHSGKQWIFLQSSQGPGLSGLGIHERGVVSFSAEPSPDGKYSVGGHWGRYTDEAALGANEGIVSGSLCFLDGDRTLWAALTFLSETDGLRWEEQFAATLAGESDVAVLAGAERSDLFLPLIRNELVPRRAVWETVASSWLPALGMAHIPVLPWDGGENVVIDGLDSDVAWQGASNTHDDGVTTGWPASRRPALHARWQDDGLLLFFAASGIPTSQPALEVSVLTELAVPANRSVWYSFFVENGEPAGSVRSVSGAPEPWQADWFAAERLDGTDWSCELLVPFAALNLDTMPAKGDCWRINGKLTDPAVEAPESALVVWGTPQVQNILNGALLEFRASDA